jgi:thymidine kinase
MFGSKTSGMIKLVDRYRYQQKKVALFKPYKDDRFSTQEIIAHSGESTKAIPISTGTDLIEYLASSMERFDTVAVDEAFMIEGVSKSLIWLYKEGMNVVVSSLTLSAGGEVFEEMRDILPWATQVHVNTAVCQCGEDAVFTYKKSDNDQLIQVGGEELYEPRCWKCHPKMRGDED